MSLGHGMANAAFKDTSVHNITKANILAFCAHGTGEDVIRKHFGVESNDQGNVANDNKSQRYDRLFRALIRAGRLAHKGHGVYKKVGA